MALTAPISSSRNPFYCVSFGEIRRASSSSPNYVSGIFGQKLTSEAIQSPHLRFLKGNPMLTRKASCEPTAITKDVTDYKAITIAETENGSDLFADLKDRLLTFKKNKYQENLEHYKNLAEGQAPKFMIIACADSRVCPSIILGFEPGEAFVIRNVANLVPRFEGGPTETNAALEFAVNSLKVPNILVIGHSCCGGIRALMGMQNDVNSSFIRSWVVVGKNARIQTEAAASKLSFDLQCRHCEKVSVNHSLVNLLTYPWIRDKVAKGELSVHGGYYDFTDCTFEKWTLDYREDNVNEYGSFTVKDRLFWT